MFKKYDIVDVDNDKYILASCPTLQLARKYLEEMKETDLKLKDFYNWNKIPQYRIIEKKEVK